MVAKLRHHFSILLTNDATIYSSLPAMRSLLTTIRILHYYCLWMTYVCTTTKKWNEHNLRRCSFSLAHIHILIWTAQCIKLVGKPLLVRFYQIGAILVPGSLKRFVHFVCSRYNNSITGYFFAATFFRTSNRHMVVMSNGMGLDSQLIVWCLVGFWMEQ